MKLRPLGDKVVLKVLDSEEKTASGIVLPDSAQEKSQQAKVMAVGPGRVVDGVKEIMELKEGDTVLFAKYSGTEVKFEGEDYLVINQKEVLAVIK